MRREKEKRNEKKKRCAGGDGMNPVFVLLVILAAILLWFLLSFVFYPLGRIIYRLVKDVVDEIKREDKEKKEE